MGLQKKAIKVMRPVKTRGLSLIENYGEKLFDDYLVTKLPSGLEIVKSGEILCLEANFKGAVGGVASRETIIVVFEDFNNANCLPTVRSDWRKGNDRPPVYLGFDFGYWYSSIKGNNAVTLKKYPDIAIEFLSLMNDGREPTVAPRLPELNS